MQIREMSHERSIALLTEVRIGRIACAQGLQPYVTPFSFAYHGNFLYSFATLGKKTAWMRANPLVCVQADKIISAADWQSVVIVGRYEELPADEEFYGVQGQAHDLLATIANWWEPGFAKTFAGGAQRVLEPVYFRISIQEISGRRATPDADP